MKRRLILFALSFLCGFFLIRCHGRNAPSYNPQKYEQVNRDTYAFKKINDGEYVVAAQDKQSLSKALDEIGCDARYVCLVERDGEYFSVQQRKRAK